MNRKRWSGRVSVVGQLALLTLLCSVQACGPAPEAGDTMNPEQGSAALPASDVGSTPAPSRLAVLWTSGDREVALKVAFMYTLNAKRQKWFDEVTLIVWGPSARLLSDHADLQDEVRGMAEAGVEVVACKACADSYGVSDALSGMGIDVKYMGRPLTDMLQGDWQVVTF